MSTGKPRDPSKERFWRRTIRQWQHSGLSITAFCRERGLSLPSFHAWRRTLRERDDQAGHFVSVRVIPDDTPHTSSATPEAALELVLGSGRRLRISTGFDEPTLRRLLALLEEGRP